MLSEEKDGVLRNVEWAYPEPPAIANVSLNPMSAATQMTIA